MPANFAGANFTNADLRDSVLTEANLTVANLTNTNLSNATLTDANLTGAFLTTRYSLPLLAPDAHLVYLGAISERLRLPGLSAYAAAKAGLEALAETLAKEERKRRVTVVRPAAVDTPLWEKVPLRLPAGALTADALARQIIEAHQDGHKGTLDIV